MVSRRAASFAVRDEDYGEVDRIIDFDGRDRLKAEEDAKDTFIRKERHRLFLERLLNDPVGRDWLWGLLQEFGTFEMRFGVSPAGTPDNAAALYHQGRHSAGWRIWTELDDAAPELASLMRREHR